MKTLDEAMTERLDFYRAEAERQKQELRRLEATREQYRAKFVELLVDHIKHQYQIHLTAADLMNWQVITIHRADLTIDYGHVRIPFALCSVNLRVNADTRDDAADPLLLDQVTPDDLKHGDRLHWIASYFQKGTPTGYSGTDFVDACCFAECGEKP